MPEIELNPNVYNESKCFAAIKPVQRSATERLWLWCMKPRRGIRAFIGGIRRQSVIIRLVIYMLIGAVGAALVLGYIAARAHDIVGSASEQYVVVVGVIIFGAIAGPLFGFLSELDHKMAEEPDDDA